MLYLSEANWCYEWKQGQNILTYVLEVLRLLLLKPGKHSWWFASGPICRPGEFACVSDGRCLPPQYVCNRRADCRDGSDEANCREWTLQVCCAQISSNSSFHVHLLGLLCFHQLTIIFYVLIKASHVHVCGDLWEWSRWPSNLLYHFQLSAIIFSYWL